MRFAIKCILLVILSGSTLLGQRSQFEGSVPAGTPSPTPLALTLTGLAVRHDARDLHRRRPLTDVAAQRRANRLADSCQSWQSISAFSVAGTAEFYQSRRHSPA